MRGGGGIGGAALIKKKKRSGELKNYKECRKHKSMSLKNVVLSKVFSTA